MSHFFAFSFLNILQLFLTYKIIRNNIIIEYTLRTNNYSGGIRRCAFMRVFFGGIAQKHACNVQFVY